MPPCHICFSPAVLAQVRQRRHFLCKMKLFSTLERVHVTTVAQNLHEITFSSETTSQIETKDLCVDKSNLLKALPGLSGSVGNCFFILQRGLVHAKPNLKARVHRAAPVPCGLCRASAPATPLGAGTRRKQRRRCGCGDRAAARRRLRTRLQAGPGVPGTTYGGGVSPISGSRART